MKMKRLAVLAALLLLLLASCSRRSVTDPGEDSDDTGDMTVLEIIDSTPELSSLAASLSTGLRQFLAEPDYNLTFFAPVNAAFDQSRFASYDLDVPFPEGQSLTNVLYFHLAPEIWMFDDILAAVEEDTVAEIYSVIGDLFFIYEDEDYEYIGDDYGVILDPGYFLDHERFYATQIYPVLFEEVDIEASNGVLHLIDDLLLTPTISEYALVGLSEGQAEFIEALDELNVFDEMLENGPFTVFLPSFGAFTAQYTPEQIDYLLAPENRDDLRRIVDYHVIVDAQLFTGAMEDGMTLTTRHGDALRVAFDAEGHLTIDGHRLSNFEYEGRIYPSFNFIWRNGVTHYLDGLLIPDGVMIPAPNELGELR